MPIKKRTLSSGKKVFDVRVQYGSVRLCRTVPSTFTEAKRVESRLLQDLINGKFEILTPSKNPKLSVYAKDYIKSVQWQKSHRRTVQLANNLVKSLGRKLLTQITTQDFIDYRTLRLEKVSHATINREHACLRRMLNLAVQSEEFLIKRNPLKGLKTLGERPAEDRTLTIDEYHKLLDAAPEYFRRIMFFACNTAMRKMEILNLRFKQIKLHLNSTVIELTDTKSGKREIVPINQEVVAQLREIAAARKIDLKNMTPVQKAEYVFTGVKGQRLQSVRKPMVRTFKTAGVELRPFHTFRHFWTTEMFRAGADVTRIKKIGRWKDLQTMLRYCHSNRADEQEAVNLLSAHLQKKPAEILKLKQRR